MNFEEKTMKTEHIYKGKLLNLRIDTVELPDKKYSKREIVEHPGAVAIVPITEENEIILVKQYRKAVESHLLEIPAGKIEINEEPRETAIRELKEETGVTAKKIEYIFEFYTSPGFSNEKMYLFVATELCEGSMELDNDEYIEVTKIEMNELINMIKKGQILDSKTIIGVYVAQKFLENK